MSGIPEGDAVGRAIPAAERQARGLAADSCGREQSRKRAGVEQRTIEKGRIPPVQIARGNVDVGAAVKGFEVEDFIGLECSLDAAVADGAHARKIAQPAGPDKGGGNVERAEESIAQQLFVAGAGRPRCGQRGEVESEAAVEERRAGLRSKRRLLRRENAEKDIGRTHRITRKKLVEVVVIVDRDSGRVRQQVAKRDLGVRQLGQIALRWCVDVEPLFRLQLEDESGGEGFRERRAISRGVRRERRISLDIGEAIALVEHDLARIGNDHGADEQAALMQIAEECVEPGCGRLPACRYRDHERTHECGEPDCALAVP